MLVVLSRSSVGKSYKFSHFAPQYCDVQFFAWCIRYRSKQILIFRPVLLVIKEPVYRHLQDFGDLYRCSDGSGDFKRHASGSFPANLRSPCQFQHRPASKLKEPVDFVGMLHRNDPFYRFCGRFYINYRRKSHNNFKKISDRRAFLRSVCTKRGRFTHNSANVAHLDVNMTLSRFRLGQTGKGLEVRYTICRRWPAGMLKGVHDS